MNGHAKGKDRLPHKFTQDGLTWPWVRRGSMASTPMDTLTASARLQNHRRPSSLWLSAAHGMSTIRGNPLPFGAVGLSPRGPGRSHPPDTTLPPSIRRARSVTGAETQKGVLSPGYARGEGIVALYLKPSVGATRDGRPIRAIVAGSATNHSSHTLTIARPSFQAQMRLAKQAYRNAAITDITRIGFF